MLINYRDHALQKAYICTKISTDRKTKKTLEN